MMKSLQKINSSTLYKLPLRVSTPENSLKQLDWNRIQRHGSANSIEWKFNPQLLPRGETSGERIMRILKGLLKRVLGQGCLNYKEMTIVSADCENVINSKRLTYLCEDETVKPISP
ncbi:hypothetical protein AVEN_168788-1 [Araneus ventricosus]|uniref:DUF5641 domain-containing protein n=1 Tax=Araneus ventricosus TaxID=182803 RepID=A0A4Y2K7G9_ARAVE|nr:hypothetical protein AVEN_168788-1 [Araneus ventricosus]